MTVDNKQWYLGAYAATASISAFSESMAKAFYAELVDLPFLAGIELPVHVLPKHDDPWRHLTLLPQDLNYILTPLPAVMQSLEGSSHFGLASLHEDGREAALSHLEKVQSLVSRLEDHCGRACVQAVQLHSAPTLSTLPSDEGADALRSSLERLRRWDWSRAELWVEHCDSFRQDHPPVKGFLNIEREILVVQEFQLGLQLNWGRSVLEGRSVESVLQHIELANKAGVLRSLFFSGVAVQDPIYGSWLDNHAVMQTNSAEPWQAKTSLLTEEAIVKALQILPAGGVHLGVKVQPAPAHLSLTDRVDCLRQHLAHLDRCYRQVTESGQQKA